MTGSWSETLFSANRRCPLRILIVTEGIIHFRESENGFSLSELINKALVPSARPWEDLQIRTARRFGDSDGCADIPNFTFDQNSFGIDKYEQVWLFGDFAEDEPTREPKLELTDGELEILLAFMNAGGGVFATGDHASLGFALCGKVPRVGSMRKWRFKFCQPGDLKAPGIEDTTRLDTLREGIDPGFQFNDQSDSIPQEIRPKFYLDRNRKSAHAHPLLRNGEFAITVLPDHVHEGECVIPENLENVIKYGKKTFYEYPKLPGKEVRLAPEVIAISTSAGGHLLNAFHEDIPPIEPRAFNVIVAYDGHQVMVDGNPIGRVVVDSSFHHFLDINLKGTDSSDPRKRGFYDNCGNPTKDYEAFKKYYRNIVTWLCPPTWKVSYYYSLLLDLRFRFPLIEELEPTPEPTYDDYLFAGAATERLIVERFSRAEALECALAISTTLPHGLPLLFSSMFDPWLPTALKKELTNPFLDFTPLLRLLLGAVMLKLATDLPADPYDTGRKLGNIATRKEDLSDMISNAVNRSVKVLPDVMAGLRRSAEEWLTTFEEAMPPRTNRDGGS
jgi:hypothetical protein